MLGKIKSILGNETVELPRKNLEYVEGIGPTYAAKLKKAGINNTAELLETCATPTGRNKLTASTGINGSMILTWVNHVDLFRIKGVGEEYADLLEEAGVDTVPELGTRNPENLHKAMTVANEKMKLVRSMPTLDDVEEWVTQAKSMDRVITY